MTFPTINWANQTFVEGDGANDVTPAEPTGAAVNDLLLLFWAADGNPTSVTVDAFWTEIRLFDHTAVTCGVWFGIRGASAPDYQVAWTTNEDAGASALHIDAGTFDATTPVELAEDVLKSGTVSPLDHGPMAMTGTEDRTIIAFHAGDGTGATTGTDSGGFTTPVLSNWTERWDEPFAAGGGQAQYGGDSAEYTGTDAALRKTRADDEWITVIFAIEPAGAAPAETRYIRSKLQSRRSLEFDADRLVSTGLVSADRST